MFTTPCFIQKNTPELRKKLRELGYYCNPYLDWSTLYTSINGVASVHSAKEKWVDELLDDNTFIDCGDNEELFLAIAALRDDSDENQWFTDGLLFWIKCDSDNIEDYQPHALELNIHKATVEELIEHFSEL